MPCSSTWRRPVTDPQVLCLGEALVDRLGPPGGDPALDQPVEDRLGGAPANVACALARLGTPVALSDVWERMPLAVSSPVCFSCAASKAQAFSRIRSGRRGSCWCVEPTGGSASFRDLPVTARGSPIRHCNRQHCLDPPAGCWWAPSPGDTAGSRSLERSCRSGTRPRHGHRCRCELAPHLLGCRC